MYDLKRIDVALRLYKNIVSDLNVKADPWQPQGDKKPDNKRPWRVSVRGDDLYGRIDEEAKAKEVAKRLQIALASIRKAADDFVQTEIDAAREGEQTNGQPSDSPNYVGS